MWSCIFTFSRAARFLVTFPYFHSFISLGLIFNRFFQWLSIFCLALPLLRTLKSLQGICALDPTNESKGFVLQPISNKINTNYVLWLIELFPRFLQFFFEFWLAHWLKETGISFTCLWMQITYRLQLSPSVPKKKPKKKSPVKNRGRLEAVYRSQNRKSRPRKTVSTVKERKRSASASPVLGRKKSESPG